MNKSSAINQKENEWKDIFRFALINIAGVASILNVFSNVTMLSLGAGEQIPSIQLSVLPLTLILAISYSFVLGRKIKNI
jgi:hypothetical protein|tara:strand:+ start:400 stop:636 length:237 start_codon:yes stop_codon:yes gene_type:complete